MSETLNLILSILFATVNTVMQIFIPYYTKNILSEGILAYNMERLWELCLLLLGLPVLTMEFSLGRAAQASPVGMYQKLQKPGHKWHIHGYLALLGNICLMSFYTTVSGWMLYYFVQFLMGNTADLGFVGILRKPPGYAGRLVV